MPTTVALPLQKRPEGTRLVDHEIDERKSDDVAVRRAVVHAATGVAPLVDHEIDERKSDDVAVRRAVVHAATVGRGRKLA